jgi:hypothetical protein
MEQGFFGGRMLLLRSFPGGTPTAVGEHFLAIFLQLLLP